MSDDHYSAGSVYLFRVGETLFKVGKSRNPSLRVKQLRALSAKERGYYAVYATPRPDAVEKEVHEYLRPHRVYAEVFDLKDNALYRCMTLLTALTDSWCFLTHDDWAAL